MCGRNIEEKEEKKTNKSEKTKEDVSLIKNTDIIKEIQFLEDLKEKVSFELDKLSKKVPDGARLRAVKCGNTYQYFLRKKGAGSNGIYIKKNDRRTAAILAQIEYDEKLKTIIQESLDELHRCRDAWIDSPFMVALNQMIPGKRELVDVPFITDENYISDWKNQEYESLGFREGVSEYYTRQGLRVRSKSEVIIADVLDEMHVPFLYEKPLKLKSGTVHPDFTLLNIKERKEVYWEHFGMMDDIEYRNNAFYKIRQYESSGLYQYESVIWTFETGNFPLNTRNLRKMIKGLKETLGY